MITHEEAVREAVETFPELTIADAVGLAATMIERLSDARGHVNKNMELHECALAHTFRVRAETIEELLMSLCLGISARKAVEAVES